MNRRLLAVAALAFLLRLGYAVHTGALWHPQTWEQEEIATNLIERHEFLFTGLGMYRAYAEPLYPFVAAGMYLATGHSFTALVLLQLLVSSVTVWLVGRLTALATNDGAVAITAAALAAVHPGLIQYSTVLHPFVFDTLGFVGAAAMLVRYRQRPELGRGAAAAAVIGAGALTRPTVLVLLLPLSWQRPRRAIALAAIAMSLVAPWTIRNAIVLHHFVLTRSGDGFVFWLGNNPYATGSATDVEGRPVIDNLPVSVRARLATVDEVTRDRYFRDEAWRYIRANPAAALWRVVQRFYYFWWFSPQWGHAYPPLLKIAYRLWWVFLLAGTVAGAVLTRNRDLQLIAACAILISLLQSVYYVEGRHRLAVEPLILPMTAAGIMCVVRVDRRRGDRGDRGREDARHRVGGAGVLRDRLPVAGSG